MELWGEVDCGGEACLLVSRVIGARGRGSGEMGLVSSRGAVVTSNMSRGASIDTWVSSRRSVPCFYAFFCFRFLRVERSWRKLRDRLNSFWKSSSTTFWTRSSVSSCSFLFWKSLIRPMSSLRILFDCLGATGFCFLECFWVFCFLLLPLAIARYSGFI